MGRWLGDGGMPLIAALGASFTTYGEGWSEARWEPTENCFNPAGTLQAGVQSVLLDAAMYFALLTVLGKDERSVTLEMKVATMRPARGGDRLTVRGEVMRLGKRVAFLQAFLRSGAEVLSHATGTFAVLRPDPIAD